MLTAPVAPRHINPYTAAFHCVRRRDTVVDLVKARWGWLLVFFAGLMVAAVVVEAFESILREHVALSYFVPLLIGHGGNTGSQSNATVIRYAPQGHVSSLLAGYAYTSAFWGSAVEMR